MRYKNTFIRVEQAFFSHLEKKVKEHNKHFDLEDKNKINMDKAVFFLNYVNLKALKYKDKLVYGYVRLHSEFLNDYLKDELKKYRTFLKSKGYLKTIPYDRENGKSIGYKVLALNQVLKNGSKRKYISYEFLSRKYEDFLNNQIEKNERIESRKKSADRSTKHLTKWLNENYIKIDWEGAFEWINKNKNLSDEKKFYYSYAVEKIRFGLWQYSRNGNDDRLHSNLTNLPSKLRPFVSGKDSCLISLDVKSSQPFIMAGVFNLLIRNKSKLIGLSELIKDTKVKKTFLSIMNLISLEPPIITDFEAYIDLVCNSDIYNYVASNLDKDFIESIEFKSKEGFYCDTVFNPSINKKEIKIFESLRGYCKTLTLEYMYCSIENDLERLKQIKKTLPKSVNKFIYDFKYCKELEVPQRKRTKKQKDKMTKTKKLFPKFLQQLEAGIILDVITKELSKIYPNMFMATIHDSIVIPLSYESEVKSFLESRFYEIFGIKAEIKRELW